GCTHRRKPDQSRFVNKAPPVALQGLLNCTRFFEQPTSRFIFLLPMDLQITNLRKDYPTRSGSLPVLRGITLHLQPGESVAVMGPSGSGKSTLLHILGTLDQPTSGSVRLADQYPSAL